MRLMTAFLDLAIQPFFRQLLFIGMSFLTLNCDVEHWPRHPCTDALLFFFFLLPYCPIPLEFESTCVTHEFLQGPLTSLGVDSAAKLFRP